MKKKKSILPKLSRTSFIATGTLIVLIGFSITFSLKTHLFNDVPESHGAYTSIQRMVDAKIISVPDDKMFYGERNITHAEMAQLVANVLLKLSPGSTADAKQIIDAATPKAADPIDRYETAVMFADVYKKIHKGNPPAATETFKDVPADHFASDAVNLMNAEKIIEGYDKGTFRGNKKVTRYDAAFLIDKLYGRLSS